MSDQARILIALILGGTLKTGSTVLVDMLKARRDLRLGAVEFLPLALDQLRFIGTPIRGSIFRTATGFERSTIARYLGIDGGCGSTV